jgi:hypothetical protein
MAANLGFGCAQKVFSKSGNVILKLKLVPYYLLSKYNPKIYHFFAISKELKCKVYYYF